MAKLTFVLEDGQEVVVPLKEHIIIGRAEDNDIVVDDERISLHHAEIVRNADGSLQLFDLKSAAGTFVNGESQLSCTLLHGDTIAFGPLVGTLDLEEPAETSPVLATPAATPPASAPAAEPPDNAHTEAVAKWEAERNRLKAEAEAAAKELRDWQQRAEKERAMHLARVESLQAQEKKLAPTKAAVEQAENAHREWLESISALAGQHADKSAALERLNTQHYEKSTEVQRLTAATTAAQQELEKLAAQKDETAALLKQVRDECEQDEALLNSLRQQIIEHEKRIVEEEARHAALSTATLELSAKQKRDEAAVQDLEKLLIGLEQRGAAAEGSLQRMQDDLASCEKDLAARKAELANCEKNIGTRSAELVAETNRLAEAKSKRAELEQLNQELAATKQQLADARQRLAAVKQRYRDAQAGGTQVASQLAAPRRHSAHDEAPSKTVATPDAEHKAQHGELAGQIEAARRELAELETRIASLRQSQSVSETETAPNTATIPQPRVVQVETIRIAPIPIKSERTRGPGTKQSAATGAGKSR
jgi:pSer/pThr/pTyr-binding forkhead associated (FHA) protein/predicted  nucleic acid-binding Zn-ribbon protein